MVVSGVVPVAAIVPVFPSIVRIPALYKDHYHTRVHETVGLEKYGSLLLKRKKFVTRPSVLCWRWAKS